MATLESLGYIFAADSMCVGLPVQISKQLCPKARTRKNTTCWSKDTRSVFIQISAVGSEKHVSNVTEGITVVQGRPKPKSLILVPIESACATSY